MRYYFVIFLAERSFYRKTHLRKGREGMKTFGDFQNKGKSPLPPPGLSQNLIKKQKKNHFGNSLKKPRVFTPSLSVSVYLIELNIKIIRI